MDALKVLHVLGELRSSGAEVALKVAGQKWRSMSVEALVLSTGREVGPYAEELEGAGYRVVHIPFRKSPTFFLDYVRTLRRERIDVAHVHTERAFFWLSICARIVGARVVRTVRSSFGFQGILRWRRGAQRLLARAVGVIFVSVGPSVQENETVRFRNPTRIIVNWFDAPRFVPPTEAERHRERDRLGLPPDRPVVVVVGNCAPVKNHEPLLRAVAQHCSEPYLLHVGEESDRRSECELSLSLGIRGRCRFLGRVDPLPALYAADLFVMPSLYEGLGVASVEALATGLPALLTDVPGSRDLREVAANTTWAGTSEHDLLDGLNRALAGAPLPFDAEAKARQHERVASLFSAESSIAAYETLYSNAKIR